MSRKVKKDSDCADCLCRICARNVNNDSYNPLEEFPNCSCDNCTLGVSTVIETTDDCSRFLPDIEDENSLEATMTFEEANEKIKSCYRVAMKAFGCTYFHNICIRCVHKPQCNRKEPLIEKCNFYEA